MKQHLTLCCNVDEEIFCLLRGNEGHLVGPRLAQGQTRYGILLDPIFSQWAFKLQASVGEY